MVGYQQCLHLYRRLTGWLWDSGKILLNQWDGMVRFDFHKYTSRTASNEQYLVFILQILQLHASQLGRWLEQRVHQDLRGWIIAKKCEETEETKWVWTGFDLMHPPQYRVCKTIWKKCVKDERCITCCLAWHQVVVQNNDLDWRLSLKACVVKIAFCRWKRSSSRRPPWKTLEHQTPSGPLQKLIDFFNWDWDWGQLELIYTTLIKQLLAGSFVSLVLYRFGQEGAIDGSAYPRIFLLPHELQEPTSWWNQTTSPVISIGHSPSGHDLIATAGWDTAGRVLRAVARIWFG